MDAQERDAPGRLTPEEARRLEEARRRGFHALMLALDRLRPGAASALGGAATPHEEALRFRHDPSLSFSTADVVAVGEVEIPAETGDGGSPRHVIQVTTSFLGLTGEVSPLPPYLAEEVAQEVAQEEEPPRQREFLDVFHHRAISFFHRAGAKHDLGAGALSDQTDDWSRRLLAILGRDAPQGAAPSPEDLPRWQILRFAPLFAERAMTAVALEACLTDVLGGVLRGAGVSVEQFAGAWVELSQDERTRVGASASELGRSFVLGSKVYDRTGRFRVVIGPLDAEGYAWFAAPEEVSVVRRLVRELAGEDLDVELVLRIAPRAAPGFALSSSGRYRLGRNTWLGCQSRETRVTVDG